MKKLIHEPLVHFLALTAVLFGIGTLRSEELQAHLDANVDPYWQEARISFTHVNFTYGTGGFAYYVKLRSA